MITIKTFSELNELLFETDPENLCCKENEIFDEYAPCIKFILYDITHTYLSPIVAIQNEWNMRFDKELEDQDLINKIIEIINRGLQD